MSLPTKHNDRQSTETILHRKLHAIVIHNLRFYYGIRNCPRPYYAPFLPGKIMGISQESTLMEKYMP